MLKSKIINYKIDGVFSILFNDIFDNKLDGIYVYNPFSTYPIYTFINSPKSSDYCTITTTINTNDIKIPANNIDIFNKKISVEEKNIQKKIFDVNTDDILHSNLELNTEIN